MAATRTNMQACQTILLVLLVCGRDEASAQSAAGKNHTLYLLSLLSYPNNNTSLKPATSDANDIIPGAYLAVSDINNRSDVLADYRLELIAADDGCNISWVGIINLINNLYYADHKQIVGIVGPRCSDSTKAVASLTGRPEIALLNVHLGNAPELANRTLYPYSYGIRPPTSVAVDAVVALFSYNKWTRAGVLYNPDMLVDYNSFVLFQKKLTRIASLNFVSPASLTYLPLDELRNSFVRVIVSFLRGETLKRVLCLAYYKNMTYPGYQWILFEPNNDSNVTFVYQGEQYECSGEQLVMTQNKSINIVSDNPPGDTATVSNINQRILFDVCEFNILCYILFDVVWALALALNNTVKPLEESGLSLYNYTYGKYAYTQIVQQQMNTLSFSGEWGAVQFNSSTGFISNITCTIYQSDYSTPIGYYTFPDGVLEVNSSIAVFVSTNFEEKLILVSTPLAVVVIIVEAVAAVLVIWVHILNTVYRNQKNIKTSSARLNHFAYVGCYVILSGTLLYTIMDTFNINMYSKTVLCNIFPWTLFTGLTLVFGTVTVKTWRLYYIIRSVLKHKKISRIASRDRSLIIVIIALISLSAVLCLVWTLYDPLMRRTDATLTREGGILVLVMKESCSCTYEVEWVGVGIVYEAILIICTVFFAFSTRSIMFKEFQSQSTILLAYLLTLTSIVGGVIYYITHTIGAQTDVSFGILCFTLMIIVYVCVICLFLPPVLPIMKGWLPVKKCPAAINLPDITDERSLLVR